MKTPFSHKLTAFLAATLAIAAPALAATGEPEQVTVAGEQVKEIIPGMLQGQLSN